MSLIDRQSREPALDTWSVPESRELSDYDIAAQRQMLITHEFKLRNPDATMADVIEFERRQFGWGIRLAITEALEGIADEIG